MSANPRLTEKGRLNQIGNYPEERDGAEEGIRTLDLILGKDALYR